MNQLSDSLFAVSLLGYLLALVVFGVAETLRRTPARRPQVAVAVAAPGTVARPGAPAASPWLTASRASAGGAVAVAVATVAQAACLVTRAVAAGRVPWGNMYEFIVAVTLVGAATWLVLAARHPAVRPLGLYVASCAVILLGAAGLHLYTPAGPLVPALQSAWLAVHVSAAAVATGLFLVGFLAAVALLLRSRHERRSGGRSADVRDTLGARLPTEPLLRRLSFRMHSVGFVIWTFAVMAGAVWAEASWGRYWGWDPKETWAFISWVAYAAYLHAHATPSVRAPVAAWIAVVGWLTMMFNLFAVNLVFSGLHSYAGT
ncbi:c-type cytochrome biogenesis protein CcsB [Micromonospora endolithica]|uniref:C-type cytochrome biogenesis protein CcsB n=1 Tax=Micromonospora endolithica TaxID=230091 RepID=A0A3A9ZT11_9ACTN|nr:c-type cytochrome biogenesis protein CcsB [Micromonospora endolithica]RKN51241.1 c-type cytochrome biogenesis protein CcsB [Micromonospora endolithica]TWJ20957.1 cytochrome c-type biogenesis protein CcsB [Micromonospora endolithica]